MKKALIIVNYNDSAAAIQLAEKAETFECLDRIYIVDNCSTDDSWAALQCCVGSRTGLIQTGENRGYSAAMNTGSREAVQELGDCLLLISNSDIEIEDEHCLRSLFQAMEAGWAVVGPVVHQGNELSRGWRLPKPMDELMMNIPLVFRAYEKRKLLYSNSHYSDAVSQVDAVSGCFFGIRADFWKAMGWFDEGVFLYYEENILGAMAKKYGQHIGIVNEAKVIHRHSVSVDRTMDHLRKFDRLKTSQRYFQKKYNHASHTELFLMKASADAAQMIYRICRKDS